MGKDSFARVAISENHPNYETCIKRSADLYYRSDDIRSPFARDYNRILHCTAYRRLKHKTQVFLPRLMIIFVHAWSMLIT